MERELAGDFEMDEAALLYDDLGVTPALAGVESFEDSKTLLEKLRAEEERRERGRGETHRPAQKGTKLSLLPHSISNLI